MYLHSTCHVPEESNRFLPSTLDQGHQRWSLSFCSVWGWQRRHALQRGSGMVSRWVTFSDLEMVLFSTWSLCEISDFSKQEPIRISHQSTRLSLFDAWQVNQSLRVSASTEALPSKVARKMASAGFQSSYHEMHACVENDMVWLHPKTSLFLAPTKKMTTWLPDSTDVDKNRLVSRSL